MAPILNNEELRELAFSAPEGKKQVGFCNVKTGDLPRNYTREQAFHWRETAKTAEYFRLRHAGHSPRQIIAAGDWHIA